MYVKDHGEGHKVNNFGKKGKALSQGMYIWNPYL